MNEALVRAFDIATRHTISNLEIWNLEFIRDFEDEKCTSLVFFNFSFKNGFYYFQKIPNLP